MMTRLEDIESDICDDLELLAQVVEGDRERFKEMLAFFCSCHGVTLGAQLDQMNKALCTFNSIVCDAAQEVVDGERELRKHDGRTYIK